MSLCWNSFSRHKEIADGLKASTKIISLTEIKLTLFSICPTVYKDGFAQLSNCDLLRQCEFKIIFLCFSIELFRGEFYSVATNRYRGNSSILAPLCCCRYRSCVVYNFPLLLLLKPCAKVDVALPLFISL